MFKAFEFCTLTAGKIVPTGPEWLHEIKYDGYRVFCRARLNHRVGG